MMKEACKGNKKRTWGAWGYKSCKGVYVKINILKIIFHLRVNSLSGCEMGPSSTSLASPAGDGCAKKKSRIPVIHVYL